MWADLVDDFIASEDVRGLASKSLGTLQQQLGFFCTHAVTADVAFGEVTSDFLRDFCVMRAEGKSYSTAKAVVWSLKGLFGWLRVSGRSGEDPSKPLRYPRYRARTTLPCFLVKDQLAGVLRGSLEHDNFSDFTVLSMLSATGLRPGDICSLDCVNVDLEAQTVRGRVKGGWIKETVLSDSLTLILRRHLSKADGTTALFRNTCGGRVSVPYIRKMVRRAGKRANLPFSLLSIHLRHTFGTHAAARHGRPVTQALLGHRRGDVTDVYTHLCPEHFLPLMNCHPYNDTEEVTQ